jgi:ubiquinone/menaquinone biosynthesis C-methylase UbiE
MAKTQQDFIPALRFRVFTPFYDTIQRWVVRDAHFKRRLIEQAAIQPGQRVLDVGCGTGTLVLMVKQAHPEAEVVGLDADPEMLKNARAKAAREALAAKFDQGMASELPYPDASFDRVLSSLMIHHLKTADKQKTAREIYRVLKPGGELHVLDFGKPRTFYGKLIGRVLHGFEETGDNFAGRLPGIFEQGGLSVREAGDFQTFFGTLTFLQGKKL